MLPTATPTPTDLLTRPLHGDLEVPADLHGFGGLHGGLALGMAHRAMASVDGLGALRSLTGSFLRPLRGRVTVSTEVLRVGATAQTVAAVVSADGVAGLRATATFGRPLAAAAPRVIAPTRHHAGPPEAHEPFALPPDIVPFARHVEIRPVTENRPFGGAAEAELTAWIRLVDDDAPVDAGRLVMLVDALAPSYTALLTDLVLVPTVELTVRPAAGLVAAASPWVLLEARTTQAAADGWLIEQITAWGVDGALLGVAEQLRVVAR
ncbi:MAG TPA: thioesterase family protein [Acidimicrobiales bacterium]|nr:thioesterase family protein [Acidimicrobiales bacterium]